MTPELKRHTKQFKARHGALTLNIVLVGHMGSGKSTLGKRLANAIDMQFVDADIAIAESAGQSIPDMFANHGEDYFRDGEKRVIKRLLTEEAPLVLATGGGAFMSDETRAIVAQTSLSVWLKPSMQTLIARTSGRGHRPLLVGKNPRAVFQSLFETRNPVYQEADLILRLKNDSPDSALTALLARLDKAIQKKLV